MENKQKMVVGGVVAVLSICVAAIVLGFALMSNNGKTDVGPGMNRDSLNLPAETTSTTTTPAASSGTSTAPTPSTRSSNPLQIGFNFIRFFMNDHRPKTGGLTGATDLTTSYLQPSAILADFANLGVDTYRQFPLADLYWSTVEPKQGSWSFANQDKVIPVSSQTPIVELFAMQYASPTAPWDTTFQKTLGPEAKAYLDQVIARYGASVKYWEIGNEMDHWRAADPGVTLPKNTNAAMRIPAVAPTGGFTPEEQGKFFAQVADYIRSKDSDAVIVLPGMSGLDDYQINTWLAGVIKGGGVKAFDIINYHFYGDWSKYATKRANLQTFINANGLSSKPVWLTETGSTSEVSQTTYSNYPNSEDSQAADIFRRLIQAYGSGDALAMWHTYIGSPTDATNIWGGFGVLTDKDVKKKSYYSFKLLTDELIPFASVTRVSTSSNQNVYKVVTVAGATKYVAWGSGTYTVPSGVGSMQSVVPSDVNGSFVTESDIGTSITLTDIPVLLK